MRRPPPSESELLAIKIECVEDQLRCLRDELRRVRRIEKIAALYVAEKDYEASEDGLEEFCDDLSFAIRSLCSEEAAIFAPAFLSVFVAPQ